MSSPEVGVCRFCLGRSQVDHHIFKTQDLHSKIVACIPLKICEADSLPKKICSSCIEKIDQIFEYYNMAKCAERELLQRHYGYQTFLEKKSEKDGAFTLDQIKNEPEDDYNYEQPRLFAGDEQTVSRYTQTEDELFQDHPMETINMKYQSVDFDQYSSEDDLTLNNVIKIPPIKLKLKNEPIEEFCSIPDKIVRRKKNDEYIPKKSRGRPKGSVNRKSNLKTKKSKNNEKHIENINVKTEDCTNNVDIENPNSNEEKKVFPADNAKLWQCLTCLIHVNSKSELLRHYKDHIKNPSKLEVSHKSDEVLTRIEEDCETESMEIDEKNPNFLVVESNNGLEFQCRKCNKSFVNKRALFRHLISHDDSRPFVCNLCGRAYKRAYEILLHGRAHSGEKTLFCRYELCDYSTVYRGALLSHHKRHDPDFKYTCDICNKGFDVLTWFTEHKNIHTGAKPFSCDICGKNFAYSRYLASHRKTVHPETNARQLVYRCDKCNLEFSYRKKLQRHLANAHSEEYSTQVLCDICGKCLTSREHLKFHRRIHTGEKPHVCRTCGKGFVKKCNLTLHERIHSGERPHVCSHCGKAFSQRSTLVIHERYHSGARPYQCDHCKKGFVAKGLLSMHQKTCS